MTKYILHGGVTKGADPMNDSFFQEVTRESAGKTRILLNYFARKPEEYEQSAKEDKKRFLENSPHTDVEFDIADPHRLAEQLERCPIMYIKGGNTPLLLKLLSHAQDFRKCINGRVIAGVSAGVNVLSAYYWSNHNTRIMEGLGILNIKVICHFHPEDNEIVKKLLSYKEDLPLLTLPEYHWAVMYR